MNRNIQNYLNVSCQIHRRRHQNHRCRHHSHHHHHHYRNIEFDKRHIYQMVYKNLHLYHMRYIAPQANRHKGTLPFID